MIPSFDSHVLFQMGGWPPRVVMFVNNAMHSMMMTRSLGDTKFKEGAGVTAEPELGKHEVSAEDEVMVIASDGVWEMLSNEQAPTLRPRFANPAPRTLQRGSIEP